MKTTKIVDATALVKGTGLAVKATLDAACQSYSLELRVSGVTWSQTFRSAVERQGVTLGQVTSSRDVTLNGDTGTDNLNIVNVAFSGLIRQTELNVQRLPNTAVHTRDCPNGQYLYVTLESNMLGQADVWLVEILNVQPA